MELPEDWTCDSNDAVKLHLVSLSYPSISTELAPRFTYPIFGEVEKIFGYKDLSIDVSFAEDTLLTLLEIKWAEKLKSVVSQDDGNLETSMREYLDPDLHLDRTEWLLACSKASKDFQPHGEKVHAYQSQGQNHCVYKASLADRDFARVLDRMQIFSILYIEGASLIDTEDDRFDVFMIYRETDGNFCFIGYCTCYRFYFFDKMKHSFEHMRYRISQFIILPAFQKEGHGGHLYDAIVQNCLANPLVLEITVEDPSEAFDDLRDRRDLLRLARDSSFQRCLETLPINKDWSKITRRQLKLAPRQFARLTEMVCLHNLEPNDKLQLKLYRELVKTRLYKKNKDVLSALPSSERRDKLEETYQTQIQGYSRLLEGLRGNFMSVDRPQTKRPLGQQRQEQPQNGVNHPTNKRQKVA